MAELVLGVTKSVVMGAVTQVKLAIEEEKKIRDTVQRDLLFITDEFEMMHSFLKVADKERAKNEVVKTWVKQVRDLAYDVEDCIEFIGHLDHKPAWWRRLFVRCMLAAALPVDEAVDNIKHLRARVEDVSLRNVRYGLLSDSGSKFVRQQQQPVFSSTLSETASNFLLEARDTPGDLTELITREDDGLKVISVWGSGGDFGTMPVIEKAYEDLQICQAFRSRAWVKVIHPFDPREFLCSFLTQLYTNKCLQQGSTIDVLKKMELTTTTKEGLVEEFMNQLSDQTYLVVLEDVSTLAEWDSIRVYLPHTNNGSCIVVHTQELEVASLCIGYSFGISELKKLSDDHSVCVLFKKGREGVMSAKKRAAQAWVDKCHVFGRDSVSHIIGDDWKHVLSVKIFPVWGISGVGKSCVVRDLYYRFVTETDSIFEKFGWVHVSHPFNVVELSRRLLLDMNSESLQHGRMVRFKDPIEECRALLSHEKNTVVIDGLQSTEQWDILKSALALGTSRSRIIVITNEESEATYCTSESKLVYSIKCLEFEYALELFKYTVDRHTHALHQYIGKKYYSDLSPTVTDQIKLITHKCGGIPKVIVAVADFFATELTHCGEIEDSADWSVLKHNFIHQLGTHRAFDCLRGLFAWVHSYIRTCPDFLRPCIFYLPIFPLNHSIRRRRLVRRWIAEGYSRDTKDSTSEENGEKFFSMLVKLSMTRIVGSTPRMSDCNITTSLCQINSFFGEYIISWPMEENFTFALEGRCGMSSQRTGRHLTIGRAWDRDEIVFQSIDFSRLRSLTVFGEWKSIFISNKMRLLRVLDLENASDLSNVDTENIVTILPRLKFLSLRGHEEISYLPESLGDLKQLQTLDVRYTSVRKLPKSIINLPKLQYIRVGPKKHDDTSTVKILPSAVGQRWATLLSRLSEFCMHHCNGGIEVPGGVGNLSALHTLGVIDVGGAKGKAVLRGLKNLSQLHKLGLSGVNQKNKEELSSSISGHGHLESLSVQLDKVNISGCLDGIAQPAANLRSLKLYGLLDLPVWIEQLTSLRKLILQMENLTHTEIEKLSHLPKLQVLRLCLKQSSLKLSGDFNELSILEIDCNSSLIDIVIECKDLEVLKIHCTNVPSLIVGGLAWLPELREVWLSESSSDRLKEDLRTQLVGSRSTYKPVLKEIPTTLTRFLDEKL